VSCPRIERGGCRSQNSHACVQSAGVVVVRIAMPLCGVQGATVVRIVMPESRAWEAEWEGCHIQNSHSCVCTEGGGAVVVRIVTPRCRERGVVLLRIVMPAYITRGAVQSE
jgi:hypothetical protein